MKRVCSSVVLVALLVCSPIAARAADVVLNWNAIAVDTAIQNGANPFAQARWMRRSCNSPSLKRSTQLPATTNRTSEPSSRRQEHRRMPPQLKPRTMCWSTIFLL